MSQDNGLKSEFRRSSTAHPFGGPVAWIPRAEASELLSSAIEANLKSSTNCNDVRQERNTIGPGGA